jgi:uncharacterized membrane protein YhiD involved in acid resistance
MNRERRGMSIGLGIPTILVIFVCLGMCILSLLTYLEAQQNQKTTNKEIEYVTSYYEADAKAQELIEEIENGQNIKFKVSESKDGVDTYLFKIQKNQELCVKIKENKVISYRVREKDGS